MTRVLRETRRFMASWPGPGVVAVSGGADSVALLCTLKECSVPLTIAHVNHQLRGENPMATKPSCANSAVRLVWNAALKA